MKTSNIIGISGKMGAGKDTFAAIIQYHIAKHEIESNGLSPTLMPSFNQFISGSPLVRVDGWKTKRFADKLKECASIILGVPRIKFEDQEFKKELMPVEWNRVSGNGMRVEAMSYRTMLQELGTEVGRSIHPNFWVNALFSEFNEGCKWIIPDVRFPNEADRIKKLGGKLVRIVGSSERSHSSSHESELAMDGYEGFDCTIYNCGTYEDLSRQAFLFLTENGIIKNGKTDETSTEKES